MRFIAYDDYSSYLSSLRNKRIIHLCATAFFRNFQRSKIFYHNIHSGSRQSSYQTLLISNILDKSYILRSWEKSISLSIFFIAPASRLFPTVNCTLHSFIFTSLTLPCDAYSRRFIFQWVWFTKSSTKLMHRILIVLFIFVQVTISI